MFHCFGADDPCRSAECGYDVQDCAEEAGCGAICNKIYIAWIFLVGYDTIINHTVACAEKWETALDLVEAEDSEWTDCWYSMAVSDFNQDSHINFREFTLVAGILGNGSPYKYVGANCSDCVGMEDYNPVYGG